MKHSLFFALLFCQAALASSKKYDVDPDHAFAAAAKSVSAATCVTGEDDQKRSIQFINGGFHGYLQVSAEGDGSLVSVWAFGKHAGDLESKIFDGISFALKGGTFQVNLKLLSKCADTLAKRDREQMMANARAEAALPISPASIAIHAAAEMVKSALIQESAASGWAIVGESEHQLTVFRDSAAPRNGSWLASSLILGPGNTIQAYRVNVQFMISSSGEGVIVNTASEVVVQNGYGRAALIPVNNNPQVQSQLQSFLDTVKARAEAK